MADPEDLSTLGAILQLGAEYLNEQDEADDAANAPKMRQALAIIASLVPVEVAENEPTDEPEDE